MKTYQWEYRVMLGLVVVLLILLMQAVLSARAEVRDDLRRQDVTNLKHALEQYYNKHQFYPTPPKGSPDCTASDPSSWLFGTDTPLLREQTIDAIPHDTREDNDHVYTYCVTDRDQTGHSQGYYLQAQLERREAARQAFDEDEERKFYFRVLHDNNQTLYRVCGGTEQQCEG